MSRQMMACVLAVPLPYGRFFFAFIAAPLVPMKRPVRNSADRPPVTLNYFSLARASFAAQVTVRTLQGD